MHENHRGFLIRQIAFWAIAHAAALGLFQFAREFTVCWRLTALPDVYDAPTSKRVYKAKFTHEKAKEIILEGSGTHFDPRIVEAFLAKEEAFIEICEMLDSSQAPSSATLSDLATQAQTVAC